MSTPDSTGLSRRSFLEISAGAIAGMAVLSMPHISFAAKVEITPVTLAACPEDPQTAVQKSKMVNAGWDKLIIIGIHFHPSALGIRE